MNCKSTVFSLLSITALLTGCATTQSEITHNNFNSMLWVQTAAECEANSIQAYNSVESNIDAALRDKSWTAALEQGTNYSMLPPAIVLDIDETVLDNSQYQAQLVLGNENFSPETWDEWIAMESATAVSGAVDFINSVAMLGVEVFYITNRQCSVRSEGGLECPQEKDSINNLLKVGIERAEPEHIMLRDEKPNWSSEKESRREEIASEYRILMLFGDDLGDFLPDVKSNITPEQREELVEKYSEHWGRKWFILSNPTYGSWESILNEPKSGYLRSTEQQ